MPALFRRSRRDDGDDVEVHGSSTSIAALIADHLEAGADEEPLSHRDFRESIRDRGRSQDEVLTAIHTAARNSGRR